METNQLEKQFEMWNRFLYMVIGSVITLLIISSGTVTYGTEWPGFGNYAGGLWASLQFLTALPGFYLLWGRRWRPLALPERINTIFGYLAASWLNLFSIGLLMEAPPATDYYFVIAGSALVLILGYIWTRKRTSIPREEMFP
jgi:hypothetical protein